MDYENEAVETQETDAAADDAQMEALEEEEQDESEDLEDVIAEADEEKPQNGQPEEQGTSEPGWIRKRIDKAVSKALAENEQRIRAEYDAKIAPLVEKMLDQEARDLVRQGEFKNLDRAKEYLRLKQGQGSSPAPAADERPRDGQGRFTSESDMQIKVRAQLMAKQATKIKESRGIDVLAEYYNNEDVKKKVVSGEWDMYDVADNMNKRKSSRPKAPAPMRSPNGVTGTKLNAIDTMSDEQFDKLEKRIKEGARYSLKK